MSTIHVQRLLVAMLLLLAMASPVSAATPFASSPSLFAGYWHEFVEHWLGMLQKQNGIVVFALGVGAVSLFIITRGKWKK